MPDPIGAAASRDEYVGVSDNLRHWNILRVAVLKVIIALKGGLLNVLSIGRAASSIAGALAIKCAGIMTSPVFFQLQGRTTVWFHSLSRRAVGRAAFNSAVDPRPGGSWSGPATHTSPASDRKPSCTSRPRRGRDDRRTAFEASSGSDGSGSSSRGP